MRVSSRSKNATPANEVSIGMKDKSAKGKHTGQGHNFCEIEHAGQGMQGC